MTFELKTRTDEEGIEQEYLEETITKTEQTKTVLSLSGVESKIAELSEQIAELEERRAVLESQLKKFTVKEAKA